MLNLLAFVINILFIRLFAVALEAIYFMHIDKESSLTSLLMVALFPLGGIAYTFYDALAKKIDKNIKIFLIIFMLLTLITSAVTTSYQVSNNTRENFFTELFKNKE